MRVTSPDVMAEILAAPLPRGWVRGLLPADLAPRQAVVWLAPLTLGDACREADLQRLALKAGYTDEAGNAALLGAAVLVDPEAWCPEGDPPPPGALERFFDGPCQLGAADAGLPILMALLDATGFVDVEPQEAPQTLAEARERARGRGCWVAGLLPQRPEAEVWVAPYTEGDRATAADQATVDLGPEGAPIRVQSAATFRKWLVMASVRTGPGGPPLLTSSLAALLPYGAACAIELVATRLTLGGASGSPRRVRFHSVATDDAEPRPGGCDSVVVGGEAPPPADGVDLPAE